MSLRAVGIGAGAVVASFFLVRVLDRASSSQGSAVDPATPPMPLPGSGDQPVRILPGPLVMFPGRTYFAVLETNGSVAAAANPDRIKAKAEEMGFRDVAVFTQRPQFFPGDVKGDYYVRATYVNQQQQTLPVKTSVFLGSVVVLDAYVAA